MASGGRNRRLTITDIDESAGYLTRFKEAVSESAVVYRAKEAASEAAYVAGKLAKSTGKAAWLLGTTMLVLGVPLMILLDREQQFNDLDAQQSMLLGTPSAV